MTQAVSVLVFAVTLGCLGGCASETGSSRGSAEGPAGEFGNAPGGGAGAGAFGNSGVSTQTVGTGTQGDAAAGSPNECGGEIFEGEVKDRLDIFVVFDLSGSMFLPSAGGPMGGGCYSGFEAACSMMAPGTSNNIYGPTSSALRAFVEAPESSGVGIAIRGFSSECDEAVMAMPDVSMDTLPNNAPAVTAWLDQKAASNTYGGTETVPALRGGVQFMRQWLGDNPNSKGVILLVTDGQPDNDCAGDDVAGVAADALSGSPAIPTYVLGLGNIAGLNAVAAAGGTGQAFIVDDPSASGTAVTEQLNAIRGDARPLPCEFIIPAGGEQTPDLVNLDYTASGMPAPSTVPRVDGAPSCGASGGWYYDNPAAPTTMVTCDATCSQLSGDGGRVDIALGCPTVILE